MNHKLLLKIAYEVAGQSPDTSNQNGALLVDGDGKILIQNCNHFPRGVDREKALADRDEKLQHVIHAEDGAIIKAAAKGLLTSGLTMICPWAACMHCARSIIVSHIQTLVVHTRRMDTTPDRWKPEVDKALAWLARAGVEIIYVDGEISDAPNILVNGESWKP